MIQKGIVSYSGYMLITIEVTNAEYIPLLHNFLEQTGDYDLTYIIMYLIDGEPYITPYSKMPWTFVRNIIQELIELTGSVMVTIISATLLGGIIDGKAINNSI